jgi:PAS domain S-box-containing protein
MDSDPRVRALIDRFEELRGRSAFTQEIIEGAAEGIIVYDTELRYKVWNRFMENLTGKKAAEVVGQVAPVIFKHLRESGLDDALRRALGGEIVQTPDVLVHMPDGRGVWESNRFAPLRDSQGQIVGVIGLISDVTQRKEAELEVQRLKDRLQAENVYLQEEIRTEHNFEDIVGRSMELGEALRKVERVAPTDATVLITGETGTGKELFARAIHSRSARRDRPLVKVNCGAIPAGLVESELFGHVKGAFTGALANRVGRFQVADGGTLFLDEVGELPPDTQVKLLRVIQEREFEPVGTSKTVHVDVRLIAATNRDLEAELRAGRFRSDLHYRLNVFPLEIPPLRKRRGDIPLLAAFFLTRLAHKFGKTLDGFSKRSMDCLTRYDWPGNVRELENVVERATILAQGTIIEIEPGLLGGTGPAGSVGDETLEQIERAHIVKVLKSTRGVVEGPQGAAIVLGLHPNTLRSRIKKLGIERAHYDIS